MSFHQFEVYVAHPKKFVVLLLLGTYTANFQKETDNSKYNGQKFREMRISHYVMRNIISRNFQCEFRVTENKAFLRVGYLK